MPCLNSWWASRLDWGRLALLQPGGPRATAGLADGGRLVGVVRCGAA